ncbi:MAG: hypothetical protein AAF293_05365 [Pseudomonadota bacterium]
MSGYPVDELMRKAALDQTLAPKIGKLLAYESLYLLLYDAEEFHIQVQHHIANSKRNHYEREVARTSKIFKDHVSDQAWTNIGIAIVEAVATLGFGTLIKGAQVAMVVGRSFQAVSLAADLNTIYSTVSDLGGSDVSVEQREFLKDSRNRMLIEAAFKTVRKEAEKVASEEMARWTPHTLSGISLYYRWLNDPKWKWLGTNELDAGYLEDFLKHTALQIVLEGKIRERVMKETPQPSLIEGLWTGKWVNVPIVDSGVAYVMAEVLHMLYKSYGSCDRSLGDAKKRNEWLVDQMNNLQWDLDVEWTDVHGDD